MSGDRWEDEKGRPWVDFSAADRARKLMQDYLAKHQPKKEAKEQSDGKEEARRKPEEDPKT